MTDCKHPGYLVTDGQLLCMKCSVPSPTTQLVNREFVPVPQVADCPHCGKGIEMQVRQNQIKSVKRATIEDKMMPKPEDKAEYMHKGWPKGMPRKPRE